MFSLSPFSVFSPDAQHPAGGECRPARGRESTIQNDEFRIQSEYEFGRVKDVLIRWKFAVLFRFVGMFLLRRHRVCVNRLLHPQEGSRVNEATGPPVEGAAESRRKPNESTETSIGSTSDQGVD